MTISRDLSQQRWELFVFRTTFKFGYREFEAIFKTTLGRYSPFKEKSLEVLKK
jgi:hypothetical protein